MHHSRLQWFQGDVVIRNQFQIHIVTSLIVVGGGFIFKLGPTEWLLILLCVCLVIIAEIFNTVIEYICDLISMDISPEIKIIKDLGAAAVLLMAFMSSIIGCIIFLPKIYQNIFSI